MAANITTDPFNQTFTLMAADGTPIDVSVPDLDAFILYSVNICINYASQLGASLVLLIIIALLTKPEKRDSPIFILNTLSLALNFIRNILFCLYFTGPFSETYAYFAQDYSRVPRSAYATSVAATVLTLLLLICVEISLIFQTQVVCVTLREVHRRTILALSVLIASIAIGFRLALCIENSEYIISLMYLESLTWLSSASNITTTISIFWFFGVFVTKLGFALRQRRKLGLRRFGPMQIIFIMGCQTLVIPALFSILQYVKVLPAMDSNVLTLVAIFLPLSALWASSSIPTRAEALNEGSDRRNFFVNSMASTAMSSNGKSVNGPLSSHRSSTRTTISPLLSPTKVRANDVNVDVEAQGLGR